MGGHVTDSNGYDVTFASDPACANPLSFEMEKYVASTGEVDAWVKVPTLSHSVDTIIYMCYGNSSITTDQSSKTSVWDSNFKAVYHLPNGSTVTANDSTSNSNNCTSTSTPTAIAGKVDGGATFASSSLNFESCGTGSSLAGLGTGQATWSFWINSAFSGNWGILSKNDGNSAGGAGWWINFFNSTPSNGAKGIRLTLERSTTNLRIGAAAPTANTWTHVTIVSDGTNTNTADKIYYNGVQQTLTTSNNGSGTSASDSTNNMWLGIPSPVTESGITQTRMNGSIDEVKISNTMRSADWILTEYNNQLLADKSGGASGFYTLGSEGAPSITTPGAPTSVSAVSGDASATVSFTAPASNGGATITGYTVTSSPGSITATGASSPITITGLTNSTVYTFTVTATNSAGTGSASSPSNSVTPVATPVVPDAPTITSVTPSNGQVSVAFSAPASDGGSSITGYTVSSSPGGFTATGASSPIAVTGLTNGTAYTFTMTATNAIGHSASSSPSSSATPATVPGAPTIGTATAGDASASVSFTAPVSNGGSAITYYTVTSSPGSLTAFGASSPITITGLTNDTAYTFTVKATNSMGTSTASSATSSVTPHSASATVPGTPTITSTVAGNTRALVIFNAPSNGGSTITNYTVTSSPGGFTGTGTTTGIYVNGLTNGTPYTFTVSATNAVGTGSASSPSSSVTPFAVTPLNYPVIHLIEENRSYEDIGLPGATIMPYLSSLIATSGALTTNYYANTHPSIPNYHWMLSGGSGGVTTNDCTSTFTNDNIFRHLISQGITFRFYIESLGNGNTGTDWVNCTSGVRATNSNWGWGGEYSDIRNQTTSEKNAEFVDFSQLATDLANHTLPQMVFIVPNLADDQHPPADMTVADTWLQNHIANLIASSYFQIGGTGLLAVNWDEGNWDSVLTTSFNDYRCSSTVSTGCGGHMPTVLYGPHVKKNYQDGTFYDHSSMLRTMMEALGFSTGFPGASASATSMTASFINGSVSTPDTTRPTATLTYSDSDRIVKSGDVLNITATIDEDLLDSPALKLAITGAATVASTSMTKASTTAYTYSYTVGSGDGTATVWLSNATDASGNVVNNAPINATFTIDNTAPTNQNTVFSSGTSKIGGATVTIVSSGDSTNNVWFAPSGTTTFVEGNTMTKAGGTATSILAPNTSGTYKLYVIDAAGNVSSPSSATLTVVDPTPVTGAVTYSTSSALKSGDTLTITVTFNQAVSDSPVPKIAITGSNTVASTSMTKTSTTVYTYTHTVGAGNGVATVWLSDASDSFGNTVTSTPTSGATFTVDNTVPTVSLTSPTTGSTVKGTITPTGSASDNVSVSGVKFYIDGTLVGSEDTSSPYSVSLDTITKSDGSHTFIAVARDSAGNFATSTSATVTIDNTAPVLSSIASSTTNTTATVTWTTNEASDSKVSYGTVSGTYTTSTSSASMVTSHSLSLSSLTNTTTYYYVVVSADAVGNISTSTEKTLYTSANPDTTPPTVSLTSPTTGSSVRGTLSLTATASDDIAVSGVKFYINGVLIGSEDTSSPYTGSLDTTTKTDGSYTIVAVARDSSNNFATSTSATVTIDNTAPTNEDTVFSSGTSKIGGVTVTIVSSGDSTNNVWFAPSGTTNFVEGNTMTKAGGTATSILAPNTSGTYKLYVIDAAGNVSNPSSATLTVTDPAVSISSVSSGSVSSSGATVTWSTNVSASSEVQYGLTSSYGLTTGEADTSPTVTSHSVSLTSLLACTTYHYRARSVDGSSNESFSSDDTFTTTGCSSNATVSSVTDSTIDVASGGTVNLSNTVLTVPSGFTTASSSIVFQAKELDATVFFAGVGTPSGVNRVGSHVITLKAFSDNGSLLSSFDSPLTVSMSYSDSDVSGIDESSLKIYRYDASGGWTALSSCTVDTTANIVTCSTDGFSDFSIFGSASVSHSSSGGGGGGGGGGSVSYSTGSTGVSYGCTDPKATNYNPNATSNPSLCSYPTLVTKLGSKEAYVFKRKMYLGDVGEDVKMLQIYLNTHGYPIAKSGIGSLGNETTKFGGATKAALIKFQKDNGILPATGAFGPATMLALNQVLAIEANSIKQSMATSATTTSEKSQAQVKATIPTAELFPRDLEVGSVGEDVRALQIYLNNNGYPVANSGPGSLDHETTRFGGATKQALKKFQKDHGLSQSGMLGPLTRGILNKL